MLIRMLNLNRTLAIVAVVALLSLVLIGAFALGQNQPASAANPAPISYAAPIASGVGQTVSTRVISVSGSAEQRVAPDKATLTFRIMKRGRAVSIIQAENDRTSANVIAALRKAGVADKDIEPGGLNVNEETNYTNGETVIDYVVTTEAVVRTTDLANVRTFLRAAFDGGATTVDLQFSSSKLRELRDEARKAAIEAATDKATKLTAAAGARRGSVITIQETDDNNYWWFGARTANISQNTQTVQNGPVSDTMNEQFGGGKITVSASVNVTFAIEG
jgi:uncharacterized protein